MKVLMMVFATMLVACAPAFAGFEVFQSTTSLGVVNKVKCSTGMTCTKVGDKLNMVVGPAGVLENVISPATGATLTGAQCGSLVLNSPSAISLTLPTGAAGIIGCKYKFLLAYASGVTVDPDGSSTIYGLTNSAGDRILNSTEGSYIELIYGKTNKWYATPGLVSGGAIWTDNN